MTKYVSTDYDGCSYITAGKRYVVFDVDRCGGWITADRGQEIYILFDQCGHIDGRPWSIHEGHDEHTPKTWGEMTDAEKGALLLAHHEEKEIERSHNRGAMWKCRANNLWHDNHCYRIKPEPKRETVTLYSGSDLGWKWMGSRTGALDTHRITFDTLDGEPVLDSIRMEKIGEGDQ